jgi:hypothetical protein
MRGADTEQPHSREVKILLALLLADYIGILFYSGVLMLYMTVLAPENLIYPEGDALSWILPLFFFGGYLSYALGGIVLGHFLRGIWRMFMPLGVIALIAAFITPIYTFVRSAEADLSPILPRSEFFVGTWQDNRRLLVLHSDGAFELVYTTERYRDKPILSGTWETDKRGSDLLLHPASETGERRWDITYFERQYFITYGLCEAPGADAWTGNLGLMRVGRDWD